MPRGETVEQVLDRGIDRVRHELLTALHIGRLTPGDRVPSIRRLADLTGMNRKTVHRAYRRMAEEGILETRPGSGTFVTETACGPVGHTPVRDLLSIANRCRAMAGGLGVSPEQLAEFLRLFYGPGLPGRPLVVVECNGEQLGLLELELRTHLGVHPIPVLLPDLLANPRSVLAHGRGVVTTDCHRAEIAEKLDPLGIPVYSVALDPHFPRRLLEHAGEAPVILVVSDHRFAPVFIRLLRRLSAPSSLIDRFTIVEPDDLDAALDDLREPSWICVSPLVNPWSDAGLPSQVRRLRLRWKLETRSLDRLRAGLALDGVSERLDRRSLEAGLGGR